MVGEAATSGAPRIAALVDRASIIVASSLSQSSRAKYHKFFTSYTQFLWSIGVFGPLLHLNVGQVLFFLSNLNLQGYSSSTVISHLSSLNFYNKASLYQDVSAHCLLRNVVSGFSKISPSLDTRVPITPSVLSTLFTAIPGSVRGLYLITIYRAMITLSFFCLLRPGEVNESPKTYNTIMYGYILPRWWSLLTHSSITRVSWW